jgi:hypothetical protein
MTNFLRNAPTSVVSLQEFERRSGFRLPQDYAMFLQRTNGGDGYCNRNQYAMLWRLEELLGLNESYEIRDYVPGLFVFGSDGGGEALAFDQRADKHSIVRVPFVGMDLGLCEQIARRFKDLVDFSLLEATTAAIPANRPQGMEIFEIQPIILGGSPTDPANKTFLTRKEHIQAVRYWNKIIKDFRKHKKN